MEFNPGDRVLFFGEIATVLPGHWDHRKILIDIPKINGRAGVLKKVLIAHQRPWCFDRALQGWKPL